MKAASVATQVIDKLLGRTDFTPPATLWVALYTESPTEDGGGIEVAGNGYARVSTPNDATMWPAAVSGNKANALAITFPSPTGAWGTLVAFGLHTHATSDALYLAGDLEDEATPDTGSPVRFDPGDLAVEEL